MKKHKSVFGILGVALLLPLTASAVDYDLTAGGSQTINGGIFQTTTIQTTGTGVIEPFLRLQNKDNEAGLNSDEGNGEVFADTKVGAWTHDVQLKDLATTTIMGELYLGFLLDINQTSANPTILFNRFDLYVNPASITDGEQDTVSDLDQFIWGMGNNTLLLNYDLNPGSGAGDLLIFAPVSYFMGLGLTADDFLYVHTEFCGSNDGFEEFATFGTPSPTLFNVPDGGATVAFLGLALVGMGLISRRQLAA
jgi:hypothetical protein